MEVVILAAGSGQRMGPLTKNKHKALLPAGQTTVLNRLLHQLHENSFNDIIIVVGHSKEQVINEVQSKPIHGQKVQFIYNSKYAEDTNIYSMKLALENINESFYLFEADILMSDDTIKEILSKKWQQQSTWFTSGPFEPEMKGGVLKESSGQVIDIDIVPQFISGTHEEYRKLTGAMFVHSKQTLTFRSLLKRSITKGLKQYYLTAWYENLDELPCHNGDLSSFKIYSFNTPEDYYSAHEDILGKVETGFSLVPVSELKPIEDFDENRARWLETEIRKQGYWTAPLVIDKQD